MRLICFLLFLFISIIGYSQPRATGLKFNDDAYKLQRKMSPSLKFNEADIPVKSLKKYCPTPGDQGNIGSCVGWSTGYGALTIADAIRKNETNKSSITSGARSALYIYLQIVEQCPEGSVISDAFDLVKEKGDCLSSSFDPKPCNAAIPASLHGDAAQFKIQDYVKLFEWDDNADKKIIATRQSLKDDKPVVIGMILTNTFYNVPTGVWDPAPGEASIGGHAMCVIGYDDQSKKFEILNSWGTNWGNAGFFKMSYEDYGRLVKYGYNFTLESAPGEEVELKGRFKFKKLVDGSFEDAPVKLANNEYTIDNIKVNDFFRIVASKSQKDSYIHIFSIKPDGSAELLFPSQRTVDGVTIKDIPVIPDDDVTLEIPENPQRGLTTDMAGNDMLCILYSNKEIEDIDDVVRSVKNGSGDFTSRLRVALGNRLIPSSDIKYTDNDMGLTAKSKKGSIAPLILKVNVKP